MQMYSIRRIKRRFC